MEHRLPGKLAEKLRTACILDCWNETDNSVIKYFYYSKKKLITSFVSPFKVI